MDVAGVRVYEIEAAVAAGADDVFYREVAVNIAAGVPGEDGGKMLRLEHTCQVRQGQIFLVVDGQRVIRQQLRKYPRTHDRVQVIRHLGGNIPADMLSVGRARVQHMEPAAHALKQRRENTLPGLHRVGVDVLEHTGAVTLVAHIVAAVFTAALAADDLAQGKCAAVRRQPVELPGKLFPVGTESVLTVEHLMAVHAQQCRGV